MFEREFEFTVYHPIEVCEERVLDLNQSNRFPPIFHLITSNVIPVKHGEYSEIHIRKSMGRGHFVQIEATIEQIDINTSKISGIAIPKGFQDSIVFLFGWAVFGMGFLSFLVHNWHMLLLGISFAIILGLVQAIQAINSRNQLIATLEATLNQPKKKRA